MLNPAIFREYDIRGVADLELRDVDIEMLGRAAGTYLRRHGGDRVIWAAIAVSALNVCAMHCCAA